MRIVLLFVALMLAAASHAATLSHGRFANVRIYQPHGAAKQVVLFLSGEEGWTGQAAALAENLARSGTFVAGIDTPAFVAELERDDASCVFPDGDLENLSHFVQAYSRLENYRAPVLVGYESGASLVYAVLAQAPADTFAGGIGLRFCPELRLKRPMCDVGSSVARLRGGARSLSPVKLAVPWLAARSAQCDGERVRRFVGEAGGEILLQDEFNQAGDAAHLALAIERLNGKRPPVSLPEPHELQDLPVIEVAAKGSSDWLAVLITGDGGWAGLDKQLAAALAKNGVAVIGLDSLRYFWKARTPKSTAADVDRIVRHYLAAWNKKRALLIGYSQGADVLPFVINGLSADTHARVQLAALLAPGERAVFEFHLSNWLRDDEEGLPLRPELARATGLRLLCVYGAEEEDSLCPSLGPTRARVVKLPGGHHFDGDYNRLATLILDQMRR